MLVGNYMTREPESVFPETTVSEACRRMSEAGVEHLPVVDHDLSFLGLVPRRLEVGGDSASASVAKASLNGTTVRADTSLIAALRLMCERCLSALPVVDEGGQLVGVLTWENMLRAIHRFLGFDQPGGCIELGLIDRAYDPVLALKALRDARIVPLSMVVGAVRDDGDEPAFYVRVPCGSVRAAERAFSEAGLVLLVPENREDE